MAKALNKLTEFTYILKADRDKPSSEQTKFKLRPMTGAQSLRGTELGVRGNTTEQFLHSLRCGLVGWENFKDDSGEVKFVADMDENISRIARDDITELHDAVYEASTLSSAERKNSSLPST